MGLDMASSGKLKADPNPPGFAQRLEYLMTGWGLKSRQVAARVGVSHQTIENWLSGANRADPETVHRVATIFGWTGRALLDGEPPHDVMTRLAELEGFRVRARRLAGEIAGVAIEPTEIEDFAPVAKRS